MAINVASLLPGIFSGINALLAASAENKLSTYNAVAQTAIKAAVTQVDGGVDSLQTAFTKFEASNPVVAQAIAEFKSLATILGLFVPTEEAIVTHVQAAITDLSGILVPQATTTTTATPAA
ncbi:hypothetical protein D3W54_06980 [Komagataeibacter medellinensis]|uniref:Phasin domain-containing protein n=1 Tax=Komagataeibacter medellinensis TaxID=1177712 RepID=A0ABQ6VWH0_9PROT|nr:hypothetical protein [Komagataeibacter medellinensis]KAB8123985.1 hypothetical protein D3W54_06980 [Komagataeibacter medellinensis]